MENELSLVPTKQLLEELFSRCDAAIFAASMDMDAEREGVQVFSKGDMIKCVGLCALSQRNVLDTYETGVDYEEDDFDGFDC